MAEKESKQVTHMNIPNEDGMIYCKRMNRVVKIKNFIHVCEGCPFFSGTAQGEGVECTWEDDREDVDVIEYVDNPYKEEEDIAIHEFKKMLKEDEDDKKDKKKK